MPTERHRFGPFELDTARRVLTRDGVPIELQPKPMAVLVRLVREPDRLHGRQEISDELWPDAVVTEQSLRQVIYRLRESLGDRADVIETVPRVGVRLAVPVRPVDEAPAGALPPELGSFVGRLEELAELAASGARVRTLVGPGGVGKTRLALRYAHRTGGAVFAELAEARTAGDVLGAVAAALGVPRLGDLAERLGHALAARGRCLVVLDNAEQVRDAVAAQVVDWVERAPEALFLVTSRMRLGVPGEAAVAVEPLPEFDAVTLFRSRARRIDGDPEAIGALVRALDGLPLAIELAAGATRARTLEGLLAALPDRFRVLVRPGEGRHDTLEAALQWSWDLLTPVERAALGQLTVFVGGFDPEAAEQVLDLPAPPGEVLEALRAQSLVQLVGERRLDLLLSVRAFVLARVDPEARAEAEARHGAHFAGWGSDAALGSLMRSGGLERRRRWLADLDNLVAAARRAIARGDGRAACGAALAVGELTRRAGPLGLALELLEAAAGVASAPERDRTRVRLWTGRVLLELGRAEDARSALEEVRAWAAGARDPRLEAEALQGLTQVEHDGGRPELAMARIRAALALVPGSDVALEARLRSTAGAIALYQGRASEAAEELARAAERHRAEGDLLNEARAVLNLAVALGRSGDVAGSGDRYREALDRMRAAGDRIGLGTTLSGLAAWCEKVGRVDEARVYLESALSLSRELGDRRAEGIALLGLGRCKAVPDPRPHLEAALAILRPLGWDYGQTYALCGLVRVELSAGRPDLALGLADEAVARAGGYPNLRVMALVERASVHLADGRLDAAAGDLAAARSLGVGGLDGATLAVTEARLALAEGDRERAERALTEAGRDPSLVAPTSEIGEAVAALRAELARAP